MASRDHVHARGHDRDRDPHGPSILRRIAILPDSGRNVDVTRMRPGRVVARSGRGPNDSGDPAASRSRPPRSSRRREVVAGVAHKVSVAALRRCIRKPGPVQTP
jgi:hypothetical protein